MEKTLVLLKPDCIQRGLVGEVITRLENKGLKILQIAEVLLDEDDVKFLYGKYAVVDWTEERFFPGIVQFMTSGISIYIALEGENAVRTVRVLIGAIEPSPGTIRGDYAIRVEIPEYMTIWHNIIHASEGITEAKSELYYFNEKKKMEFEKS
jgi:nucleoside-diphosphate kinase